MSNFVDELDQGDAPGWVPEEGDILVGKVTALSKGWSDYTQSFYPIVTLEPVLADCIPAPPRTKDDSFDGLISVHGFQYVLRDRFTAIKPKVGEVIGIKQGAKIPTKDKKRSVQTYTVRVKGRSEDIWDSMDSPRQSTAMPPLTGPKGEVVQGDPDDLPF